MATKSFTKNKILQWATVLRCSETHSEPFRKVLLPVEKVFFFGKRFSVHSLLASAVGAWEPHPLNPLKEIDALVFAPDYIIWNTAGHFYIATYFTHVTGDVYQARHKIPETFAKSAQFLN